VFYKAQSKFGACYHALKFSLRVLLKTTEADQKRRKITIDRLFEILITEIPYRIYITVLGNTYVFLEGAKSVHLKLRREEKAHGENGSDGVASRRNSDWRLSRINSDNLDKSPDHRPLMLETGRVSSVHVLTRSQHTRVHFCTQH
jgi:hypothetical protein